MLRCFVPQRLAEAQHEGFGGRIHGKSRDRLECRRAGHIDDGARRAGDHVRQERRADVHDRADVDGDEPLEIVGVAVDERSLDRKSCVVDDEVDALGNDGAEPPTTGLLRQVPGHCSAARTVGRFELVRQRCQTIFPSGDEHEIGAAGGQHSRELGAYSGTRAGDQRAARTVAKSPAAHRSVRPSSAAERRANSSYEVGARPSRVGRTVRSPAGRPWPS